MRGEQTEQSGSIGIGADLIIPLLACLLAGYYFVSTSELVWESRATGSIVGGVLVGLCAIHLARIAVLAARGKERLGFGGLFANTLFNRQRLVLMLLAFLFVGTIHWAGTTLGLFLLLVGSMLALGVRSIGTLLAVAAMTSASVYILLIAVLNSRLPHGPIENALAAAFGIGG